MQPHYSACCLHTALTWRREANPTCKGQPAWDNNRAPTTTQQPKGSCWHHVNPRAEGREKNLITRVNMYLCNSKCVPYTKWTGSMRKMLGSAKEEEEMWMKTNSWTRTRVGPTYRKGGFLSLPFSPASWESTSNSINDEHIFSYKALDISFPFQNTDRQQAMSSVLSTALQQAPGLRHRRNMGAVRHNSAPPSPAPEQAPHAWRTFQMTYRTTWLIFLQSSKSSKSKLTCN